MGLEAYEDINVSILFFMRTEQIFSNFWLVFSVVFVKWFLTKTCQTCICTLSTFSIKVASLTKVLL